MITATQPTTQNTAQAPAATPPKTSGLATDFQTFLLMLTTQAKNQDPLEPLDSSQYASQLAQFSMVEQQTRTNNLLSGLSSSMGSVNLEELTRWVGMDVRTASAFQFDGAPKTLFAQAEPAATNAVMVIRDNAGTVIDRIAVPKSEAEFVWAGVDGDGNPLPKGSYSATLESYDGDKLLSQKLASAYNKVKEAQSSDDTILLTLENGQVVSAAEVTAVRTGA
ncbi:flagellar hook capping FlgD N-terminal domain-containing protein [Ruegeria halocynthiae]|uniref:flagellar hook capping FlgD N-terminal domain-containing protein n=1 Tax=Ruegeria halocynthiae TaxID=985054 RepID=UPI000567B11B|nr:flagellar hook capping FlgD N-terminal domain-containing protein [Ruegeria halocynthiae]